MFTNKQDESSLGQYTLRANYVLCPHCKGDRFTASEAQLNTALATLINLDWANKSATILTCASCGQIQWFQNAPEKVN